MTKAVIILVHGIGENDAGWSTAPRASLESACTAYQDLAGQPLDELVDIEEVHYDLVFEEVRKDWNNLATTLIEHGFPGSNSLDDATRSDIAEVFDSYADAVRHATTSGHFVATHALDVLQYRFAVVQDVVRHCVAAQLARIASSYLPEDRSAPRPNFVIVGHSLGTAVAHDAIQLLGTRTWLPNAQIVSDDSLEEDLARAREWYGKNPFAPDVWRWDGLMMVANVAPVFCRPGPADARSIVKPIGTGGQPPPAVAKYYNVAHLLDPIPKVAMFSAEQTWGGAAASRSRAAQDVDNLEHFHEPNIHSLSHYLIHPRVHARLLHLARPDVFRASFVSDADQQIGSSFSDIGPAMVESARREALQAALDRLGQQAAAARAVTPKALSSIIEKFAAVLGAM